jgi:hypothetical protein
LTDVEAAAITCVSGLVLGIELIAVVARAKKADIRNPFHRGDFFAAIF